MLPTWNLAVLHSYLGNFIVFLIIIIILVIITRKAGKNLKSLRPWEPQPLSMWASSTCPGTHPCPGCTAASLTALLWPIPFLLHVLLFLFPFFFLSLFSPPFSHFFLTPILGPDWESLLGGTSERQRNPGKLGIPLGGKLKAQEQAVSICLREEGKGKGRRPYKVYARDV